MRRTKDSNLVWIGAIPEDWSVLRGKNVVKKLKRPVKETDGVITCFRDGEVTLRSKRREEGYTFSDLELGYQGIEPGDLVIHGMDGFAGAIGVSDSRGKGTPVLNVLDSKYDKRYLMYYYRTIAQCGYFESVATGIRVRTCDTNWNKISVTPCLVPTLSEQSRIVAFLDERCGKIDEAIAKHKALIEKLDEYRKAVITKAVTKGVRGEREMKGSGVEWIGDIPMDWILPRVKDNFAIISGSGFKEELQGIMDGECPICKASDISNAGHHLSCAVNYLSFRDAKNAGFSIIPQGSIIFAKIGEAMRKNNRALTVVDCCVDNNCQGLVPKDINPEFSYYLLSIVNMAWFDNAGTIPCLNNQKLRNSRFAYPSLSEQAEIVTYLDKKCAAIDSAKERHQQLIAKLEEYKKSLIYNAVTGKIEC